MEETQINLGKSSSYNEAQLRILRLNDNTELINFCRKVPLARNGDFGGEFNFKLWIETIDIIYLEIESKLHEDEKKKVKEIKELINNFIDKHPIIIKTKSGYKCYETAWNILCKEINKYDSLVRDLKDKHGYGPPDKEDPRKAASKR